MIVIAFLVAVALAADCNQAIGDTWLTSGYWVGVVINSSLAGYVVGSPFGLNLSANASTFRLTNVTTPGDQDAFPVTTNGYFPPRNQPMADYTVGLPQSPKSTSEFLSLQMAPSALYHGMVWQYVCWSCVSATFVSVVGDGD